MRLIIVIAIAFFSLVYLWRRNTVLYYLGFGKDRNGEYQDIVYSYNVLHAPINYKPLEVSYHFVYYSTVMLFKFILFIILSVIVYIWGDNKVLFYILALIYSFLLLNAWREYKGRRTFYNEIKGEDEYVKEFFSPILKASISIPIYQTILCILLCFA